MVDFVNRKLAEDGACEFVRLYDASNTSRLESWFVLQGVADQIGVESNTGRLGISYKPATGSCWQYGLYASCVDGPLSTTAAASKDRDEALSPERLDKVEELLNRKIAELGGRTRVKRPKGTGEALVEALSGTTEGRRWVEATARPEHHLCLIVQVADEYGREGVNPRASLSAHIALLRFDERRSLILEYETAMAARAKAMSLGSVYRIDPTKQIKVSPTHVRRLAIRTGVSENEARTLLRAFMDGRSKAKLIRAVNEAARVFDEPVSRGRPRKDDIARAA